MLLKTLPCLEQQEKGISKRLLSQLTCDQVIISFPAKSRQESMLATLVVTLVSLGAACDVTEHGAIGDGDTINTEFINAAVAACDLAMVTFPSGRWLTGTIRLRNNTQLLLEEGSVILGAPSGNYEMAERPDPAALACAPGAPFAPECQDYGHGHWPSPFCVLCHLTVTSSEL